MPNSFIPQAYQEPQDTKATTSESVKAVSDRPKKDKLGQLLLQVSQYVSVALAFLLPLAFVPGLYASLAFDKVMLSLGLALVSVMVLSLASLRFKTATTVIPLPLILYWLVVVAAFAAALLSGDLQDALRGSFMGVQTVGFLAVAGLVMTTTLVLQSAKKMTLFTLVAFAVGAAVLFLYNILRFLAGPVLDFASFGAVTTSMIGGLNDLAVYAGVTIVIGLITLLQLPLKRWMSLVVTGLILLGLCMLMVANFFYLWIIVGFFALLFLIYVLSRDTLFGEEQNTTSASPYVVFATLVVCVVSSVFVVAGDYAGGQMSRLTGVNYLEVRPSLTATIDVLRDVYQEDLLLGSGPNKFSDSWRVYKDRSINDTTFWNVNFNAGFGYVPTLFITLGILGGLLLLAFHLSFLYLGYLTLLRNDNQDRFWYYVGTVSFVSAALLWGISYVYVPGAAALLIAAMFSGLAFVSYGALVPRANKHVPLANNRKRGFLLMGIAVVVIVLAVTLLFSAARQYSAQAQFTASAQTADSIETFETAVQSAYNLYPDERFLIALNQLKLTQLQQLLAIAEPTESDQAQFASLAQQSIALANEIVLRDPSSPAGYVALAEIYSLLNQAGVEGAADNVRTSIAEAEARDPLNPSYSLSRAFLSAQGQDFESARQEITEAVTRKRNFTPAFFLLAQIAVEEGNVEQAIAATEQVVQFEPDNPIRYYQLGMLLAANAQVDEAIQAYRAALALDDNYANARYMLALALASQGDVEGALAELRRVQESNQDNEQLAALITELETNGVVGELDLGLEVPVEDESSIESTEDGVITDQAPDTDLLTTVNTEPSLDSEREEAEDTTANQE